MRPIPYHSLALVRRALKYFPRPDLLAQQTLSDWLTAQGAAYSPLLIDVTTLHYRSEPAGEGRGQTHTKAVITQKMNLVEALLTNWQGEPAAGYGGFHYGDWAGSPPQAPLTIVERLEPLDPLSNASPYQVFNGLYTRSEPPRYAPDTRLPIRAEDFQATLWKLNFHTLFKQQLDRYWAHHHDDYQRAIHIAFIAACNRQVLQGSLSEAQRRLIWRAAGLLPYGDLSVSMLNIYGYTSTDILYIRQGNGSEVVLYIPGNASPFHAFADAQAMKHWLAQQCQAAEKRSALLAHFARADWPDGLEYSGLITALLGLSLYPKAHRFSPQHPGFATSGLWEPQQIIDYRPGTYSPPIISDLFEYLTLQRKQRSYADADSQITSNHEIDKARWGNYLNLATALLAPLAILLPELAPLLVVGGLAQFGLGLDQAINGRDLQSRDAGVTELAFGLFNALPAAGQGVAKYGSVFRCTRPGFFAPVRLAQLLGTPVGAAPIAEAIDSVELAFREQAIVSNNSLAAVVARIDENLEHRFMAWLQTREGVVGEWVHYEFASDCFIRSRDSNLIAPLRWRLANAEDTALTPLRQRHIATHSQRSTTLQALGIDLDLPVDYAPYAQLQRTPIPKIISSVWLGDALLHGEFLEALVHNVRIARSSGYRYQILLSQQEPQVFQRNVQVLRTRAEGAQLLPLETQGFFQAFSRSPYYRQYLAAIEGNGGSGRNFSSACDILRYRLLNHYGGLYLDADDRLLAASKGELSPPLANVALTTTHDGLLFSPPVSNDQLGMYIKFNNSMIGSHPANPTLDAVSDEILRRYSLAPDFYDSRPDPRQAPLPFQGYARRLNLISGPGALNAVVDERLPLLRQLREICHLLVSPVYDIHATLNLGRFHAVLREHAPLDRIARIGREHSWTLT
ncbi:mannosyltransferase [Pseudomonas sp. NC26]|uniref:dermonecrotic toxin domain-containing protein n=1 Tax=Pseudomonas sp. NC26 TaxID=3114535 RepID=UPI002DF3D0D8|nr:mannosyltransferase [Pseudomonas sp. NC26]